MKEQRHSPFPKWRWIIAYWVVQAGVLYVLWPVLYVSSWSDLRGLWDWLTEGEYALVGSIYAVLMTIGQAAFVVPVRPPRSGRAGRWVRLVHHAVSAIGVGAAAGFMSWGATVAVSVSELAPPPDWFPDWAGWAFCWGVAGAACVGVFVWLRVRARDRTPLGVSVVIALTACTALVGSVVLVLDSVVRLVADEGLGGPLSGGMILAAMALSWAVATPLLIGFLERGPRDSRVARLAARLFVGTLVEAMAIIPIDIMVRRKSDCYCFEGTYWALGFCASVGLLVLGPIVYLLPLGRRRQRLVEGRCEICGYDMSGTPNAERCPECGAGWRA